jgi:hypothetical protein
MIVFCAGARTMKQRMPTMSGEKLSGSNDLIAPIYIGGKQELIWGTEAGWDVAAVVDAIHSRRLLVGTGAFQNTCAV